MHNHLELKPLCVLRLLQPSPKLVRARDGGGESNDGAWSEQQELLPDDAIVWPMQCTSSKMMRLMRLDQSLGRLAFTGASNMICRMEGTVTRIWQPLALLTP